MNQTDDRKTCTLCNRKFNSDRLEKHISICRKQKEKKRNVFDSSKQRQIIDSNDENELISKTDKFNGSQVNKSKARIVKPVIKPPIKSTINSKESDVKKNAQTGTKNAIKQMNGKVSASTTKNNSRNANLEKDQNDEKVNGNATNEMNIENQMNGNSKSQWREKNEFIKSMQTVGKENGFEDDQQTHKQESIDRESTITTNSESTATTNSTTASNASTTTLNLNITNERLNDDKRPIQINEIKPKQQRKIKPPQATRLIIKDNKTTKLNQTNSNKNTTHTIQMGKKSINTACVECAICGRTFNKAAGERHIPFCEEKQRQRKNSSNVTNEEALARFRLRNAYRSNKGIKKRDKSVPNDKKEDRFVRQSSLRRALSTIDGLDQVFNKHGQTNNHNLAASNLGSKRSTSHGSNLNRTSKYARDQSTNPKMQIITHSKTSSASSKSSAHNYSSSVGYKETAQSRVKARLNQQQKLQKQRINSNYPPKTPVMKFKEKFPNHNNKLIEFGDSQQFSQVFKKHLNNSFETNNLPKTVPGVRTGGLSPTKEIYNKNNEDIDDLEKLRTRIKEMYLSSNGCHSQNDFMNLDYHLTGTNEHTNENSFTRENSSSKMKSSKSVNDFLTMNDSFNDTIINDIELPKTCHQCSTSYITISARYCFNCGARRLGTVNSYLV